LTELQKNGQSFKQVKSYILFLGYSHSYSIAD